MSYLRGSANYVWCTTDVLGKGATGAVFKGVRKHDGEPVAVKTFNQISHMRPQEVQMREFDVLKKVKHENIVKLLAIEEEQDGRGKVIVMELCTGGSLFNILDDPENTYGLPEDEFLLVLKHLAAGIKHLRDKSLVHRDLKPGNIMKFIAEDGRIIYKLTDFGAARELEEDGEFKSLYGTEEYLHPDLYERAVLRKEGGKTYSAFVDLWSIGVTMYHVATGNLPFRPYGGRKNRETMYHLLTRKEPGVISGSQTTENGEIEWKRELPTTTQLSAGLKLLLTPLLAGLLENDARRRWSFEKFFNCVTSVLSRRQIHVFYMNRVESLRIYMDEEEHSKITNFHCLIMEQTDISPEHQILLFNGRSIGDGDKLSADIPLTAEDNPVILCHREINSVSMEWGTKDMTKFPTFPNLVNLENDSVLGKQICAVGHSYKRRIEKICRSVNLITKSVNTIAQVVNHDLRVASNQSSQVQGTVSSVSQQLGLMTQFQNTISSLVSIICPSILYQCENDSSIGVQETLKTLQTKLTSLGQSSEAHQDDFRSLTSRLLTLEQPIKILYNKLVENRDLLTEWERVVADSKDISRSPIKAGTHVCKLRDSWQRLLHNRANRSLSYNDEQFHILERIKMQEKTKSLQTLLNDECQFTLARLTELLSDWYKRAKAAFIQSEILLKDMKQFDENLHTFLSQLTESVENYQTDLEGIHITLRQFQQNQTRNGKEGSRLIESIPLVNNSSSDVGIDYQLGTNEKLDPKNNNNHRWSQKKENVRTFNDGLKKLTTMQEEVWAILKENADLMNQYQTMTMSILTPPDSISESGKNSPSSLKSVEENL